MNFIYLFSTDFLLKIHQVGLKVFKNINESQFKIPDTILNQIIRH